MALNFSVVLICRNEAQTLPRLLSSLQAFQGLGGQIVLLDTGSTDASAAIARAAGCDVHEVGERFIYTINEATSKKINRRFVADNEPGIVQAGDRLFDYSSARNYAASLAKTDMVAMPDCDEAYTSLDLDRIQQAIADGYEQLEYEFVFAHDAAGNEIVKFRHCKFYDRRKLHWVGVVHEVLAGSAKRLYLTPDIIKLEHWQNPSEHRTRYLTGLALDCFQNPTNDRNSHYFARELLYTGRYLSALKEFDRHLTLNGWPAEAAQSVIFQGDALLALGRRDEAIQKWQKAITMDSSRREAWMRLANYYYQTKDHQRAAAYAAAALTVPWSDFYANNANHYRHEPHDILYWALWYLGDRQGSYAHWQKAREYWPTNPKYRRESVFYLDFINPKVSIVIPALGREAQTKTLVESLPDLADWRNLEIIVEQDSFIDRQGAPRTLKRGIKRSTGDFVCFLGSDCLPKKGFLRKALECMYQSFQDADGLVALNDGLWQGKIATHWLASKRLLPQLDGEFFYTGYGHVGCDNELTARCQLMDRYVYCPEAVIEHRHPALGHEEDAIHKLAWSTRDQDRALLHERAAKYGFAHLLV